MSALVLFEDAGYTDLLPSTYWHCIGDLRCGRKSLIDNAAFVLRQPVTGMWIRDWLADVEAMRFQIPVNKPAKAGTVLVNSRWLLSKRVEFRDPPFVATCGESIAYISCDDRLAEKLSASLLLDVTAARQGLTGVPHEAIEADFITYPWDLVLRNARVLEQHWAGDDRSLSGKVSSSAHLIDSDHIHVGERAEIRPTAVIDASRGPVYISNDVLIDVHTYIEGPAYIGTGSLVKPQAVIRGGTTIGTFCKVAGEVSQSIIAGYSNKQHEGFLGGAYVGSWVNLGAGTTNSNLKNTYGPVTVQAGARTIETGETFLGCVVGDFVRTGIGQLIPTGGVLGFGAMVANGAFAPKYVPSLAWITASEKTRTDITKLLETARTLMARRKTQLLPPEEALFRSMPAYVDRFGI